MVSGNSTTGLGGYGGGLAAVNLTLTNSTVSGNSATGEQAYGGGIRMEMSAALRNSIVAGNSAPAGYADIRGAVTTSNGHNIFGSDVGGNVAGDLENVAAHLFAALDPITGGGLSPTMADRPRRSPCWTIRPTRPWAARSRSPGSTPTSAARPAQRPPAPIPTSARSSWRTGRARGEIVGTIAASAWWAPRRGRDPWPRRQRQSAGPGRRRPAVRRQWRGRAVRQCRDRPGDRRSWCRPLHLPRPEEAAPGGPAYEEFLGFNRSQGDKIDLRTIDADAGAGGNQKFAFVGGDPLDGPAQLRVEAFDSDFLVSGNIDSDPEADFAFIVRTGLASLRASDFLL